MCASRLPWLLFLHSVRGEVAGGFVNFLRFEIQMVDGFSETVLALRKSTLLAASFGMEGQAALPDPTERPRKRKRIEESPAQQIGAAESSTVGAVVPNGKNGKAAFDASRQL